jgi:methionyl aminopeptidase
MFTLGSPEVKIAKDGYTFKTKDKSLASHFEHTIVITETGAEILTKI